VTAAKANARLAGRSSVRLEDVLYMAPSVLEHRLMLEATASAEEVIATAMAAVARGAS
jgi:MoxR-like ATPase